MSDPVLLTLIVAAALLYDFVNGFHDAANAIATTISTHALSPRNAIILARTLNFVGAMMHTAVAYTIGKGIVASEMITMPMLLAGVVGAILWGYFTWYFGLPSSSTHALVGGLAGVALFVSGFDFDILMMKGVRKIILAMIISPLAGAALGVLTMIAFSWLVSGMRYTRSSRIFKKIQVVSAAFVALTHGMNDAQNAMGVITIALLTAGSIKTFAIPFWVRLASAFVIGLGTSVGGWRIIKTMGRKMTSMHEPITGCAAETAAGTVILAASLTGAPISTTQVAASAIAGGAMAQRLGDVRWQVVRNILLAWIFTIPGAGLFAILSYLLVKAAF